MFRHINFVILLCFCCRY